MFERLGAALLRLREEDHLKVMLINATGRYFSSGIDQKEKNVSIRHQEVPTARGIREQTRLQRNMQTILDEMEHVEKPIVVSHHAMCMGGGLEISLSCDFRIAEKAPNMPFPKDCSACSPLPTAYRG